MLSWSRRKVPGHRCGRNFLSEKASTPVSRFFQDASGRAAERTMALGVGIGAGYLFPTTFEKEVFSDLVGSAVY